MTWYVIRTNPKCERKAALWLRRAGIRVWVPKRTDLAGHGRRHLPLWPGFVLVRFTGGLVSTRGVPQFGRARQCYGVRDFICWSTRRGVEPMPIADGVVSEYMRRQRRRDYDGARLAAAERAARRDRIRRGGRVRITDGALAGMLADVQNVDGNVARLLVDLFGGRVPVTIRQFEDKVEPVATRRLAA